MALSSGIVGYNYAAGTELVKSNLPKDHIDRAKEMIPEERIQDKHKNENG